MKAILTADDYGVFDEIDDAIIEAVSQRKINSVAILPNGYNLHARVKRLANAIPRDFRVDLGCHLTFCSGKPLLRERATKNFVDGAYFKPFGKQKRAHRNKRDSELKYLEAEIRSQINSVNLALKNANMSGVKHLTCHHNTLFWFEDYLRVLLGVARDMNGKNIPVRSPFFLPEDLFSFYQKLAIPLKNRFFFFRGNQTAMRYRRWRRDFEETVPQHLEAFRTKTITGTFTHHYGPAGGARLENHEMDFQVAQRKHPALDDVFYGEHEAGAYEIIFHLIKDDYSKRNKFRKKLKNHKKRKVIYNYPGINPGYVDGRMAEMRSLMSYPLSEEKFTTWNQTVT